MLAVNLEHFSILGPAQLRVQPKAIHGEGNHDDIYTCMSK